MKWHHLFRLRYPEKPVPDPFGQRDDQALSTAPENILHDQSDEPSHYHNDTSDQLHRLYLPGQSPGITSVPSSLMTDLTSLKEKFQMLASSQQQERASQQQDKARAQELEDLLGVAVGILVSSKISAALGGGYFYNMVKRVAPKLLNEAQPTSAGYQGVGTSVSSNFGPPQTPISITKSHGQGYMQLNLPTTAPPSNNHLHMTLHGAVDDRSNTFISAPNEAYPSYDETLFNDGIDWTGTI